VDQRCKNRYFKKTAVKTKVGETFELTAKTREDTQRKRKSIKKLKRNKMISMGNIGTKRGMMTDPESKVFGSPETFFQKGFWPPEANHSYTIVLTHDVDHLAQRNVPLWSRQFGSFLKQCVFSNFSRILKKDIGGLTYSKSLLAGISLPLARLRLVKDPMEKCLRRILALEKEYNVRSTFYFIPYKGTPGFARKGEPAANYRGADYDVKKYRELLSELEAGGWEVGVHGIDAHIGPDEAAAELEVFKALLPEKTKWGMRIHWLYQPEDLWRNLKKAGFYYDTTFGSNHDIGFKEGRFHPFKKDGLWVLPMNIQDGALLAPWHRHLSRAQAWQEIRAVLDIAREKQAVVTVLWHNSSFGAPRYWEPLYRKIIEEGFNQGARFLTARQAVEKFESLEKND
jgi:peptidoglycan/xylan/chitin deacetylase (PgdA/CDA1 family)